MKNRQQIFEEKKVFLLILLFISVTVLARKDTAYRVHYRVEPQVSIMSYQQFKALNPDYCSTFEYEIIGIYNDTDRLENANEEMLELDNALKKNGFVVTNWGRGNWMYGPRMVTLELSKDDCLCTITKKYWKLKVVNDTIRNMRITEQISCNVKNEQP